ncbi:MAG TPA: fibronectin type III domain-containing protein [Chitinophagales bacterium]|nr:fibronectin type III domain-containing protein [Chitinophagales bacterium]
MKKQITVFSYFVILLLFCSYNVFSQDGVPDESFGTGGVVVLQPSSKFDNANDVEILPDGKIMVTGNAQTTAENFDVAIYRLNSDGSPDPTFGNNGLVIHDLFGLQEFAYDMKILPDGKMLVAGGTMVAQPDDIDFFCARLNADGSFDTSFGTNGVTTIHFTINEDEATAIALQPDGKIILAGYAQTGGVPTSTALARLNNDGSIDNTFSGDGKVLASVGTNSEKGAQDILLLDDGNIMTTGYIQNTTQDILVWKFTSAGEIDMTFGNSGSKTINPNNSNDIGYAITRHPLNGRILIGGRYGIGTKADAMVLSISEQGVIDSAFGTNGYATLNINFADRANAVFVQPDGKIIITGGHAASGISFYNCFTARFNEDGTIDNTFGTSNGYTLSPFGEVGSIGNDIDMQSDGKIVVAGIASQVSGNDFGILRYNNACDQTTYYTDADNDGYGDASDAGTLFCANPGTGYATDNSDCNDENAAINPAATEVVNGVDDNCNGLIDEGLCAAPVQLTVTDITASSATLNWSVVSTATKYKIRYRKAGQGNAWNFINADASLTSYTVSGLNASTHYGWQIRTLCGSSASPWSASQKFTTKVQKTGSDLTGKDTAPFIVMYPNPASGNFTVTMTLNSAANSTVDIQLVNAIGQVVFTDQVIVSGGQLNTVVNPAAGLIPGNYLVRVISGDRVYSGQVNIQE